MDCHQVTWLLTISCQNLDCGIQPKTKYVPIRKGQRTCANSIKEKVSRVVDRWNEVDSLSKGEGFELSIERIIREFQSGKLGLIPLERD